MSFRLKKIPPTYQATLKKKQKNGLDDLKPKTIDISQISSQSVGFWAHDGAAATVRLTGVISLTVTRI